MSNLDNQPGRDDRTGFSNRTPNDRIALENRRSGIGAGTITAIIVALVIAGALMLFGPWGNNDRSTVNNSSAPATSNSTPGTTTGQNSGAPRVITPTVTPAAPTTTAPAPATTR